MNRTASLDRRYRRILRGGVAASVLVHAALFASLRFEIPGLEGESVIALVAPEQWEEPTVEQAPIELIQFAAASSSTAPAAEAGAAALPPIGEAGAATLQVATSAIEANITDVAAEPAFETLAVVDPMTNAAVKPIAFDALPAVTTTAPGEAEAEDDGVEVYVPGSIGKAKRQWARGIGEADAGSGPGGLRGVIAIGGGHCPMPGRVPVSWGRIF
jgi:hypothetical protein